MFTFFMIQGSVNHSKYILVKHKNKSLLYRTNQTTTNERRFSLLISLVADIDWVATVCPGMFTPSSLVFLHII